MSNKSKKRPNNAAKQRADAKRAERRETERERVARQAQIKNVGEAFKKLGQAIKERQENAAQNPDAPAQPEAVGVLSKPDFQAISDGVTRWEWHPVEDEVQIMAHLYGRDIDGQVIKRKKGEYVVTVSMVTSRESFSANEAKAIAGALLSASVWENIWEKFVAEYIANGGRAVAPEPESGDGIVHDSKNMTCECGNEHASESDGSLDRDPRDVVAEMPREKPGSVENN